MRGLLGLLKWVWGVLILGPLLALIIDFVFQYISSGRFTISPEFSGWIKVNFIWILVGLFLTLALTIAVWCLSRREEIHALSNSIGIAIIKHGDHKRLKEEILIHDKPMIEYVRPKEMEEIDISKDRKVIIVGKPGCGKSRFLYEYLRSLNMTILVMKSGFPDRNIETFVSLAQKFGSFVLVQDDLQKAVESDKGWIDKAIQRLEDAYKRKVNGFHFLGASREESSYDFEPKQVKIDPEKFKGIEIVNICKGHYDKEIEDDVAKNLVDRSDKTPYYIISFFETLPEEKRKITQDDADRLPDKAIELWKKWMKSKEKIEAKEDQLGEQEKYALMSLSLIVKVQPRADIHLFKHFYAKLFGKESFQLIDTVTGPVQKLRRWSLIKEPKNEEYTMHDIQVEAVEQLYIRSDETYYKSLLRDKLLPLLFSLPSQRDDFLWGYAYKIYDEGFFAVEKDFFNEWLQTDKVKEISHERGWRLLFWMGRLCRKVAPKEAKKYYDEAIVRARSSREKAEALLYRSYVFCDAGNFIESIRDINEAEDLGSITPGRILGHRGRCLGQMGEIEIALKELSEGIDISRKDSQTDWRERRHLSTTIRQRGDLLLKLTGRQEEAWKDFQESLEIAENNHIHDRIGNAKRALGDYHRVKKNFDESGKCYEEALKIAKDEEYIHAEAEVLISMARLAEAQGEYEQAKGLAKEKVLSIAEECGYHALAAEAHLVLARLAIRAGNKPTARQHAEDACQLIELTQDHWARKDLEELCLNFT